ncbi:hypothetical protein M0R45_005874 [Rubus argutus]|uniref:Uncharacterized protein n=1 Tax=Rubus argutus TaxID=59490 RepID=A0AAW1YPG1_RUBAR
MVKFIEDQLAKKKGMKIDVSDEVEKELQRSEDELYKIPDHLKQERELPVWVIEVDDAGLVNRWVPSWSRQEEN